MRIALLGSLLVDDGRTTLSPRDRVVLLALASRPGAELSADTLAETLWGENVPASAHKVVQGCISRLRKALGPRAVETTAHGYRLTLHRDEMDHAQFEYLLGRARQLLAGGEPERALFVTGQARRLWRGEPFVELADWGPGRVESERLVELWRDAEDLHAEAAMRAGHHRDVLAEVSRLVAEQPTRERRWGLLALAQYQDGRQGDALQTLHRAKHTLVGELGLDPGPELTDLEQAILRQDPRLVAADPVPSNADCPYLGLIAYDITQAATFFGRESDVSACLRRLGESGVVAILGPSGSGKSSLARAGVGAALQRDGRRVKILTPGPEPADTLAALDLRPQEVLVVDQCEEALTLPPGSSQRTRFIEAVVAFAEAGQGRLVVSMRADRLGDLAGHPDLARVVESGLYLLGPMAEDDLRRAIEGPAAQAGLRVEPGLTDLLVREVMGEPAALPLLSHVLRQTWRHREGTTLTVDGYTATGGVRGAVAQSAETLFRALDERGQSIVRELMLRLVSPDEGGDPVRTRVPRRTVAGDAAHSELVERLVAARLLATDGDTIEIAHEALAVAWPRLRSWLDEDVDGLRIMRHLSVAADIWDELGRPDSELYRGVRAARAADWDARAHPTLTGAERDFLDASVALVDREQRSAEEQVRRERRLNRRLRLGLGSVAALLAVAIIAGTMALTSARRADQQAVVADARRLGAEALRSDQLDRSLLLAAAGVSLVDSVDTRTNLLATLDRAPALVRSARSAAEILHLSVNPVTDAVAVMASAGVGLELYDGQSLRRASPPDKVVGGSVLARPDGQGYAASVSGDLVETGQPPVVLLDRDGSRSAIQLGGLPPRYQVLDLGFPRRWYLGFSPDTRWFAASMVHMPEDGRTQTFVWDLGSQGRLAARLELGWVGSAPTLSPDGRTLYSGAYGLDLVPGSKGQLLVTNLPTGTARRALTPADLGVRQLDDVLALSPDGRTLAVGAGLEVVLVDTATLTARAHLAGPGSAQSLAFSRDGTRLTAGGDRLMVWDVTARQPVELLSQPGEVDDATFGRDGTTVYTKTVAGLVQAWDLEGGRRFLPGRTGEAPKVLNPWLALSPDGRRIAYTGNGPQLQIRDVASGRLGPVITPSPATQGSYNDVVWHPDGRTVNMSSGDPWVRTWDAATSRLLAERRLAPAPSTEGAAAASFTLDGKHLVVGSTEGRLHVLDARTLSPVREPIVVHPTKGGGSDPADVWNFVTSGDLHSVWVDDAVVDYVTGTVRPMPDLGLPVVNVYPSPDGRRVAVDTGPSGPGLLDATTMTWISHPAAAQAGLLGYFATTWSDDGSRVASVVDGHLSHWDGRTGRYLGSVTVPADGDADFSDDGRRLLFAGEDGSVLTWDLDPRSWTAAACRLAGRDLTEAEWRTYLPNRPFAPTCPT